MKAVKQEEPITRSRFIACPNCKTRTLKLKRIVQVGRCRSCHESYKIIILFVKTGKKDKQPQRPSLENKETNPESNLPSWQIPSDTSLFGSSKEETSTFSQTNFDWGTNSQDNQSSTGSEQ